MSTLSRQGTQDQVEPQISGSQSEPANIPMQLSENLSDTLSRTLGGITLESKEIDEIFTLFVSSLGSYMPRTKTMLTIL